MLAKKYRITQEKDFKQIFSKGQIYFSPFFNIKVLKNNLVCSRFAIIISNKISKKATVRNKFKRRLRSVIYQNLANIKKEYDILVLTKPAVTTADQAKLAQTLIFLLTKAGLYHNF